MMIWMKRRGGLWSLFYQSFLMIQSSIFILPFIPPSFGIRMLEVISPTHAIINSSITILCNYDPEGDVIYSLKWYINNLEAVSITQNKDPVLDIYPLDFVDVHNSTSGNKLFLRRFSKSSLFQIKCEVTASGTFQREEATTSIQIMAPPTHSPIIQGFKSSGYALYEEVNVTCISPAAHPLPTISWFINDQLAPESYVRYSMKNDTQLIVTLNFRVDVHHLMFGQPKMRLKCRAALSFNSSLEYEQEMSQETKLNESGSTDPVIFGVKDVYHLGDTIDATCYYRGNQTVQLQWRVNYRPVESLYLVQHEYPNYLGLKMKIGPKNLDHRNKIVIKCSASKLFMRFNHDRSLGLLNSRRSFYSLIIQMVIIQMVVIQNV